MTVIVAPQPAPRLVITDSKHTTTVTVPPSPSIIVSARGPQGPAATKDYGVLFLKNNAVPTPISAPNARAVVSGSTQVGELFNFAKDATTNSLKYLGNGGMFHLTATFNLTAGNQKTCGFYLGISRDQNAALDPNGDRISESEIYVNSSTPSNQPVAGAVQTVQQLNTNDRVFFIVQNQTSDTSIVVQFLKLIAWP